MPEQQHQRPTPVIKTSHEESNIEVSPLPTLAITIGNFLPPVMEDRKAMQVLEHAIDSWVTKQEDRSVDARKKVLDQMRNATLALESLYSRIASTY